MVEGSRGKGKGRKMWFEGIKEDMDVRGVSREDVLNRAYGAEKRLFHGKRPTLPQSGKEGSCPYGLRALATLNVNDDDDFV